MKTLLICPAEDAKSAVEISPEQASVIRGLCDRLGLRYTDQAGSADRPAKLYVARPSSVKAPQAQAKGNGLHYPLSGAYLERHPENNAPQYAVVDNETAAPLVRGADSTKLSKNFTLGEFRPKDSSYTGVRVHPDLVAKLEEIRERAGGPIQITSSYRPPAYNRKVGGVSNSTHIDGLAADIYSANLSTSQLCRICDDVIGASGGVGYYPDQGFVHIDVRGYKTRW